MLVNCVFEKRLNVVCMAWSALLKYFGYSIRKNDLAEHRLIIMDKNLMKEKFILFVINYCNLLSIEP